ncbi:uncharacterized protein SPPG_00667 [Spizellomyces punctatus DAOM BR117]|uniref:ER membrane protein complex subunit 10 n=1 Tax=Spizellomyces punctatus (strain DAOM BR117) TaxID=645134 RepID=A0A0L0HV43_SPIPD|nr:uncharacterized protein SPPG_00667 [Spizellomyces punctatus DAOM BR117]KND04983.1 hypothetical protein SPPG_00667 [Spizellomyces punctatus DAOM BR117]|eukprot:XP_016613022.1 hypothetical protein SPPG_00667 [Spizellomyces punctatus DAOM BR117]
MHFRRLLESVLLLAALAATALAQPTVLEVLHSIDDQPFTPRGSLVYDPTSPKRTANKYESEVPIPDFLKGRDTSDRSLLYRVRVKGNNGVDLSAAVPVCLLQASEYREQLTLHLDSNGGPWHMDYLVDATDCDTSRKLGRSPRTQVLLERAVDGPRPKLDQIVESTPDGKPAKEQSFLAKYWYYIVPIMIILMMGGGGEEPPQGGAPARR